MGGYKNIKPEDNPKPFTSENQPNKRRGRSIIGMVKNKLFDESEYMTLKGAELIDSRGEPTGEKADVRILLTNAEALTTLFLSKVTSDNRLLMYLIDQIDGKPLQRNEDITERRPIVITYSEKHKKKIES